MVALRPDVYLKWILPNSVPFKRDMTVNDFLGDVVEYHNNCSIVKINTK